MKLSPSFLFILSSLKPFRWLIFFKIVIATIWAIDMSLRPYIFKLIIDTMSSLRPAMPLDPLYRFIFLYLAISFMLIFINRFYDYIWLKINPPLKTHISDMLVSRMMHHSQSLFQNHFAGALGNRIKDVMSGVPDLVRLIVTHFYSDFLALLIAIGTVWSIDFQFSALLGTWLIIFCSGSYFFSKRARILSKNAAEVRTRVMGQIIDILSNILSIHLFATHRHESKNLRKHLDDYVENDQRRDWFFLKMSAFQGISFIIYQTISFVLLCRGFQAGTVTVGDFALLLTINVSIINCLWHLTEDVAKFADLTGNVSQGLRIALTPHDITDASNATSLEASRGEIVFDRVKFRYKQGPSLFEDKSITLKAGQKIGLVGYSGGGKTTFVNLILRLHDISSGRILIDGQDIRSVTQDSLHRVIGMIPQDPSLFHRSILENIRYGRIEASDQEVVKAAKKAHAHQFIANLSEGYDSLVGERGVKLSGGQRQRIAIARAFLKDAPILILDEATSQLDSLTEQHIQESLWRLMENKTTLVVAHRLSTLLRMDRILVFDHGKIVEDGTHEELLAVNGLYKTLWEAQVGGFLPAE